MIAFLDARRAGLFARSQWLPNLIAGLVVGVVALPLAMAFAIASGATPAQGIYTAIIAGAAVSLFGGSRLQIAGPTGAFVVILAGITTKYGIAGLQLATLMAGVILVVIGACKLGNIIKYIPDPVIVGFTAGIGITIWTGQWPAFFGLASAPAGHFHEKLAAMLQMLPALHIATTGIGLLSIALVLTSPYFSKRIPGPLVAMLGATLLQYFCEFDGVATIGSAYGGIPRELPGWVTPDLEFRHMIELLGPAFTIAMLGAIESLMSAVVADGMASTRHDSNQELIGQGIANILTPLFGGFAATGAIARTATNVRNGGSSPLAGLTHCLVLLLILLVFAPLAAHIPLAALAGILFVVAWNMSEVGHFITMARRAPRADVAILLITFLLTVFADLVVAVNIGVILAALLFMRRMAHSVQIEHQDEEKLTPELLYQGLMALPPGVMVYSIDGPFFFGAAENFERALGQTHTDPKVLILRLARVPYIDVTGLTSLEEMIVKFHQRHTRVMLCEASPALLVELQRGGILQQLGEENWCSTFAEALSHADADAQKRSPNPGNTK